MKSPLAITCYLLLLAFAGILLEGGHATPITYACVAPLALWVLYQVVRAIINALW